MQNIFIRSTAGPGAITQCRVGYFYYTFLERNHIHYIVGMKENVMFFFIKSDRFVGFLEKMYRGWIINLLNSF